MGILWVNELYLSPYCLESYLVKWIDPMRWWIIYPQLSLMKSHDKKNPIPQLITGKPNTNHTVLRVTFNINVYYIYIYQSINNCYKFYKSYIRQYKIKPYEKNTMACRNPNVAEAFSRTWPLARRASSVRWWWPPNWSPAVTSAPCWAGVEPWQRWGKNSVGTVVGITK